MLFIINDEHDQTHMQFTIAVTHLDIVKQRIHKLMSIIGGSVSFSETLSDETVLNVPLSWLESSQEHLEVLLINLTDVKSLDVLDDGTVLTIPNSPELEDELTFEIIPENQHDYIKKNGFCILAYKEEGLTPAIYTLDEENDLSRVYLFKQEDDLLMGIVAINDISVSAVETNFFYNKPMVTLLEEVTNRHYYPRNKLNGYLTILEMFY